MPSRPNEWSSWDASRTPSPSWLSPGTPCLAGRRRHKEHGGPGVRTQERNQARHFPEASQSDAHSLALRHVMRPGLRMLCFTWIVLGCAATHVPAPDLALEAYRDALERNDADALYALLDSEARASLSKDDVRRLLDESRAELLSRARALSSAGARAEAEARVFYIDGEHAALSLERGHFRIDAAAALPAAARTPAEALSELRRALSRRSYPALIQVLDADTREALERQLSDLVDGLAQPDALAIEVDGERAEVVVEGGHRVTLIRQDGVWKVRDFQ